MTRNAGIKWVIALFAQHCALAFVPLSVIPGISRYASVAGLLFAVGAWRRDFWGFVGVLAICVSAVLFDVFLLLFGERTEPTHVLNGLLCGAIAAALFSARRQFPRRPASRG